MSPAELRALIAAAAPGARVTVVVVEMPDGPALLAHGGAAGAAEAHGAPGLGRSGATHVLVERGAAPVPPSVLPVPKPWTPPAGPADLAPAIAARQTPFTCAELGVLLGVQPETVSNWCRTNVLRNVPKIPGAGWRIPPTSVLAMLAASVAGAFGAPNPDVAGAAPTAGAGAVPPPSAGHDGARATPAGTDADAADGGRTPTTGGPAGAASSDASAGTRPMSHVSARGKRDAGRRSAGRGPDAAPEGAADAAFDVASLGDWRRRRAGGAR